MGDLRSSASAYTQIDEGIMGSSGSGNFTDYSGTAGKPDGKGGTSGGSGGDDKCRQAFNAGLEDVALFAFFKANGTVPSTGSTLSLAFRHRVIAIDQSGTEVGSLPTKFNYLAACLKDGIQYAGVVTSSTASPVPQVDADFVAI